MYKTALSISLLLALIVSSNTWLLYSYYFYNYPQGYKVWPRFSYWDNWGKLDQNIKNVNLRWFLTVYKCKHYNDKKLIVNPVGKDKIITNKFRLTIYNPLSTRAKASVDAIIVYFEGWGVSPYHKRIHLNKKTLVFGPHTNIYYSLIISTRQKINLYLLFINS